MQYSMSRRTKRKWNGEEREIVKLQLLRTRAFCVCLATEVDLDTGRLPISWKSSIAKGGTAKRFLRKKWALKFDHFEVLLEAQVNISILLFTGRL